MPLSYANFLKIIPDEETKKEGPKPLPVAGILGLV